MKVVRLLSRVALLAALCATLVPAAPAMAARRHTLKEGVRLLGKMNSARSSKVAAAATSGASAGVVRGVGMPSVEPSATLEPQYVNQWALPFIGAPAAWASTEGSATAVIAVLDTGVDATHPDLLGRVDLASAKDFVNGDTDASDDNGHGTQVASIAAANMDNPGGYMVGMAPGATIVPVKVLGADGSGTIANLCSGLYWAVAHDADIINLSLTVQPATEEEFWDLMDAMDFASQFSLIVASSGDTGGTAHPEVQLPAAFPGVVAVGGTTDGNALMATSSRGWDAGDIYQEWQANVLCAPGANITAAANGGTFGAMNGTGASAPLVSGTLALMVSRFPTRDPYDVAQQVLDATTEVDSNGDGTIEPWYANTLGFGVLNAGSAVTRDVELNDAEETSPMLAVPSVTATEEFELGDGRDIYRVTLPKGAKIIGSLTGAPGMDLDIEVYPVDDRGFYEFDGSYSIQSGFPKRIGWIAPWTGTYYVAVYRNLGHGAYTLNLSKKLAVSTLSKPVACSAKSPYYAATRVKPDVKYRWVGNLAPRHAAGGKAVKLVVNKRLSNGSYRWVKTVTAGNANRLSFTQYQALFSLPAGRYQIVPVAVEDTLHARTAGTANYVWVH